MFPMKNEEAGCAYWPCDSGCVCIPPLPFGICVANTYKDDVKMVGKNAKICQSDDECKTKGFRSYCALNINSEGDYGWCFASESEAEKILFSKSPASKTTTFAEDFLRMPRNIA